MKEIIPIPEGVKAEASDSSITLSGKNGEIKNNFVDPNIKLKINPDNIEINSKSESRKEKRILKTYKAHINNMITGVTEGFEYQMKIVFTHFPMTVKVEGEKLRIDNFIGERSPRFAKIVPGAEIKISKQDVTITGTNLKAVSQTAGNIENKTRVIGRDRRVFQDGIYITSKGK